MADASEEPERIRLPAIGFFIAALFLFSVAAQVRNDAMTKQVPGAFFVLAPAGAALSILVFCLWPVPVSTRLMQMLARHRWKLALAGLAALAASVDEWWILMPDMFYRFLLWWGAP